ncbi:acyl-CoA dehydrogenase family protein, partial [Gordonia terrae]
MMKYQFTEEQAALRELVAEIAAKADPRRSYADDGPAIDREIWTAFLGSGLVGIGVGEEWGGGGAGPVESVIVAEELGHAVAAVPFPEHAAAALLIQGSSDDEPRRRHLTALCSGDAVGAVALDSGGSLTAVRDGDSWSLNGTVPLVANAAAADLFVVPAETTDSGTSWFVVPDASVATPLPTIDRTRTAARLDFDGAPAEALGAVDARPAASLLRTLAAAEAVGVAAYCLSAASEYARQRHQFGHPIGTFQAVKHKLADMLVEVENARSATYGAAWALLDDPADSLTVSMAQAESTQNAIQVA